MDQVDLPNWHLGECECDEGTYQGYKVHAWACDWLKCVLDECNCDEIAEEQAWRDHEEYLASAEWPEDEEYPYEPADLR